MDNINTKTQNLSIGFFNTTPDKTIILCKYIQYHNQALTGSLNRLDQDFVSIRVSSQKYKITSSG